MNPKEPQKDSQAAHHDAATAAASTSTPQQLAATTVVTGPETTPDAGEKASKTDAKPAKSNRKATNADTKGAKTETQATESSKKVADAAKKLVDTALSEAGKQPAAAPAGPAKTIKILRSHPEVGAWPGETTTVNADLADRLIAEKFAAAE